MVYFFHDMHIVLYFPLENIVLEIVLRIHYNKPVKVLLMLMHYGKIFTQLHMVSRQIYHSASPCAILAFRLCPCAICNITHSALAAVL